MMNLPHLHQNDIERPILYHFLTICFSFSSRSKLRDETWRDPWTRRTLPVARRTARRTRDEKTYFHKTHLRTHVKIACSRMTLIPLFTIFSLNLLKTFN
jgi:hypothetical protein